MHLIGVVSYCNASYPPGAQVPVTCPMSSRSSQLLTTDSIMVKQCHLSGKQLFELASSNEKGKTAQVLCKQNCSTWWISLARSLQLTVEPFRLPDLQQTQFCRSSWTQRLCVIQAVCVRMQSDTQGVNSATCSSMTCMQQSLTVCLHVCSVCSCAERLVP